MTREEHLQWCKERALEYVRRGEINNAITSMGSDLSKHPETKNHPGITIGVGLLMIGSLSTQRDAERFIKGFN